jgi:hypothetical protein
MDRRAFIGTLAGSLLAAPLVAEAQQAGKMYRIGYLSTRSSTAPLLRRSGKGCANSGGLKGRISSSSIDLQRAGSIGCPPSRLSWSDSRWTSS